MSENQKTKVQATAIAVDLQTLVIRQRIQKLEKVLGECLWLLNINMGFECEIRRNLEPGPKRIYWNARKVLEEKIAV